MSHRFVLQHQQAITISIREVGYYNCACAFICYPLYLLIAKTSGTMNIHNFAWLKGLYPRPKTQEQNPIPESRQSQGQDTSTSKFPEFSITQRSYAPNTPEPQK